MTLGKRLLAPYLDEYRAKRQALNAAAGFAGAGAVELGKRAYNMYRRYKMRRQLRRKMSRKTGRSGRILYSDTNKGSSDWMKRRRRTSVRAYRSKLLRASADADHDRSVYAAGAVTKPLPSNPALKHVSYLGQPIRNSFWTSAGGYTGTKTFVKNDLTLRGGTIKQYIYNPNEHPLRVEFYEIWSKELVPGWTDGDYNAAWDPTLIDDFQRYFKLGATKIITINPHTRVNFNWTIKPQKVDQSIFNAGCKRVMYFMAIQSSVAGAGQNAIYSAQHSLSFVGDAINET